MTKQTKNAPPWLPLGEKVLLQKKENSPEKEEKKTGSGIIIPKTVTAVHGPQSPVAIVIAISPALEGEWHNRGYDDEELPLNVGDTVVFSHHGNDEVKFGGQKYIIASIENILARKIQ